METPREITVLQTAIILISTIIGVGVLALPRIAVNYADSGAPLLTIAGIIVSSIGLLLITILGMRFPNKTIIRYSGDILGKWGGILGSVLVIGYFALLTALASREFGEVVVTSVLRRTPLEVTVIVMLLLAAVTTRNDSTTFAFIHHFYSPIIVGPALLIVGLSLKNAEVVRLFPVWGNEPHNLLEGTFTIAALFQGSFILTMIIPAMRNPKKAMKASLWGLGISGGLYLLIVIAAVSVFGGEEIKNLLWPTLELAKTTSLPANILERLDAAFLAIWVTAVFTTLFSSYYLMVQASAELFYLRDHKLFSLFYLPLVFILAMVPQNVLQMYQVIETVGRYGLFVTIVYPALLLATAMIRKKRGKPRAHKPMV